MDERYEDCKTDCLIRIRDLRNMLDAIERRVRDDNGFINELGEMQSQPTILIAFWNAYVGGSFGISCNIATDS